MMDFFTSNFMLQTPTNNDHQHQPPFSSLSTLPTCTPQDYHGIPPMLGKRSMSFSGVDMFHGEANNGCGGGGGVGGCGVSGEEDNFSDDGSQVGEKKRRLNMEQVRTLEKTFELGNKLDPERKVHLAKALGLQPRQIAIWFQNRRARWKTKQLEKDYEILKIKFESLKSDNESLLSHNHKLQSELSTLKGREPTESINLNKDTDQGSCSNKSENSSDMKLDMSTRTATTATAAATASDSVSVQPSSSSRLFFPPSSSSSNLSRPHHVFQNPNPTPAGGRLDQSVKEENFTNMFCGIDDQSGFWPWMEPPNFN